MIEKIRKHMAENKMSVLVLILLVAAGVVILLLGRFMPEPEELISEVFAPPEPMPVTETDEDFRFELENRLAEFFSLVEGAGRVRVMVSPLGSSETVYATNVNETRSYSDEQDSQGGTRETRHYQSNEQIVIVSDTPLVIHEREPRIEGIVIIAEGGDSPFVRDALTRAARAMLGLDAHMIQVLTMETNSRGE